MPNKERPKNDVMTDDELLNNLEFKLTERVLKKRFPWITKVAIPEDIPINMYSAVIFLDVYVDLKKMKSFYNTDYSDYVSYFITRGDDGKSIIINDSFYYADSFVNIPDPLVINHEIDSNFDTLHKSMIIPEKMRLDKRLRINRFKVDPHTSI